MLHFNSFLILHKSVHYNINNKQNQSSLSLGSFSSLVGQEDHIS